LFRTVQAEEVFVREIGARDMRLLVLGALLVGTAFLALNLHYTGGELVLPLDDAYIYAQYARSIAEGHPLRYTPEADPSAGITGLLYPFLIAPLYALGLRGGAFIASIFGVQLALFAASAPLVYSLAGGSLRRETSRLAAWLFVLSGPAAWGFLSGMEIGPFVFVWLLASLALVRGRERAAIAGTSLLTLIRPDGLVFAGLAWLLLPATRAAGRPRRAARLAWLIPLSVGLIPVVVNVVLTGGPAPASGRPKSPFALPGHHLPTILQHVIGFLVTTLKGLLSGVGGGEIDGTLNRLDTWAHVAPFTLLFLVLGASVALTRAGRRREPDGPAIAALWLIAGLAWVAVSTGSTTHFFRYLLPVWPALLIVTAEGVDALAERLDRTTMLARPVFVGAASYLLIYSLLGVATFGLLYGQLAYGFQRQYVACARWVDENLPSDARIASLDAGIIGYYANRPFFDLFGLTTPSMTRATSFYADDEGSKFEALERLPAGERPTHFMLHETRFQHENWNPWSPLFAAGENGDPVVLHRCSSRIPVPLVGLRMQVVPADWSSAGVGDAPADAATSGLVDRVDVADLESERGHAVTIESDSPGFLGSNRIVERDDAAGRAIVDGGRGIDGRISMRFSGLAAGRDALVRLRLLPVEGGERLVLSVADGPPVEWNLPPAPARGWHEPAFVVDGSRVTGEDLEIEIAGTMMIFHAWAAQDPDRFEPSD
jgi:hypothetical protein